VECKRRCVNVRIVSDPRRAFRPALRVTGISDDWYRSTKEVIVISLRTPRSAGENFGSTWERQRQVRKPWRQGWKRRQQVWECQRQVWEGRRQAWKHLGAPSTSLGAPQITVKQSGKNDIFLGNVSGVPGNHSYYLVQQFLNLMYSVCILINRSI